jgi:serine/threonine protein kinase
MSVPIDPTASSDGKPNPLTLGTRYIEGTPAETEFDTSHRERAASASLMTSGLPEVPGYRIVREIARGGMGVVYLAEDLTLGREVALKTLLAGADARRFQVESRITARLPHPGIPPVHASGALTDGSPYLVMKLIEGATLATMLPHSPTPIGSDMAADLTRIFEQVAEAVGFAHSRGVIHRDLKPSNIMIGAFGEVQVMDWGLATELGTGSGATPARSPQEADSTPSIDALADGSPLGDDEESTATRYDALTHYGSTALTRAGSVLGTPAYMAPEQARGESVGAAADVFSLGATLAAILTGRGVFVADTAGESLRMARAGDTAPCLERIAASGADADLVDIARRCLQVEPLDRPVDARAVAQLVRSHRQSVEDRLQRAELARVEAEGERRLAARRAEEERSRRTLQWRASALLVGTLAVGVIGTSVGFFHADRARRNEADARQDEAAAMQREKKRADSESKARAAAQAASAEADRQRHEVLVEHRVAMAVREFLQNGFLTQANPWSRARSGLTPVGGEITVRQLLDRAAAEFAPDRIGTRLPERPLEQAEILQTIADAFEGQRDYPKANEFAVAAERTLERAVGPMHPRTLAAMTELAFLQLAARRYGDAVGRIITLADRLEKSLNEPASGAKVDGEAVARRFDAVLAATELRCDPRRHVLPDLTLGNAEALTLLLRIRMALPMFERLRERSSGRWGERDRRTMLAAALLGFGRLATGGLPEARTLLERSVAIEVDTRGRDSLLSGALREILVATYESEETAHDLQARLFTENAELYRRTLGPDHPTTLMSLYYVGGAHHSGGRDAEAVGYYRQAIAGLEKSLGGEHPETLRIRVDLGEALRGARRPVEAIEALEPARKVMLRDRPETDPGRLVALSQVALAQLEAGRYQEAIAGLESLRAIRRRLGPNLPETLQISGALATAYRLSGQMAQGRALALETLTAIERSGLSEPVFQRAVSNLLDTLESGEAADEADRWRAKLVTATKRSAGERSAAAAQALAEWTRSLLRRNRWEEAESQAAEALSIREDLVKKPGSRVEAWQVGSIRSMLGRAILGRGRAAEAETLLVAAHAELLRLEPSLPPPGEPLIDSFERMADLAQARQRPEERSRLLQEAARRRQAARLSPRGP